MSATRSITHKRVCCYHCGNELLVSTRALSLFCPLCNQRVSVEDHFISSRYQQSHIDTCGSLVVSAGGDLRARLRVHSLEVDGRLHGNVVVTDKVAINSSGSVTGDITAKRLEVQCGGLLKGFCKIERQEE